MTEVGVYGENLEFWQRAWSGVKTPYTQMPPLPYIDQIISVLEPLAGGRILDLGCGSGWLSILLARKGYQVTGVDCAGHALELARMWAAEENLKLDMQVADIAELGFAAGSFDAVVANSIFEHLTWEFALACAGRLKEILVPGGVFFACFDRVGTGPGESYKLEDGTQVYTDKGRKGMMLRNFSDDELRVLLKDFQIEDFQTIESGSRIVVARA